jgi:hypothetical protein
MIRIILNEETGNYALEELQTEIGPSYIIDPTKTDFDSVEDEVNWAKIAPNWLKDQGTIIVLLGDKEHPHSVLGNPRADENELNGLSDYLNTRFWEIPGEVIVTELERAIDSNKDNNHKRAIKDESL